MKNWKKFFGMLGALIFALGLNAMEFKSNPNVIAELEYFYAKDGTITGRRVNDSIQMYSYDKRGQLLAVIDGDGKPVEQYVYDPAGNILSKTVNGKTTTFIYDKANQLVSSTVDGKTTDYRYDGAGRLVQEGDKTYQYGYLDKILNVLENGETIAGFDYHMNGQIASVRRTATLPAQASADASGAGETIENFLWDGLALIHRGGTSYINEPAVTGGNPILADGNVLFNDMLGTTLGVKSGESFNQITMTAFGETENKGAMFTGKPIVGEIGYVFLFRVYRADQGKWQTQDPIGYPDGWNNLAYVNNCVTDFYDIAGMWAAGVEYDGRSNDQGIVLLARTLYMSTGNTPFSLYLLSKVIDDTASTDSAGVVIPGYIIDKIKQDSAMNSLKNAIRNQVNSLAMGGTKTFSNTPLTSTVLDDDIDVANSIHGVTFYVTGTITRTNNWTVTLTISINDPYDFNANSGNPAVSALGRLYDHGWLTVFNVHGSFQYTVTE